MNAAVYELARGARVLVGRLRLRIPDSSKWNRMLSTIPRRLLAKAVGRPLFRSLGHQALRQQTRRDRAFVPGCRGRGVRLPRSGKTTTIRLVMSLSSRMPAALASQAWTAGSDQWTKRGCWATFSGNSRSIPTPFRLSPSCLLLRRALPRPGLRFAAFIGSVWPSLPQARCPLLRRFSLAPLSGGTQRSGRTSAGQDGRSPSFLTSRREDRLTASFKWATASSP
jgi:hypothetical protein